MAKFGVKCFDQAIWDQKQHTTIEAEDELQAAMLVCGERLKEGGKAGQLRAEVWPISKPSAKKVFHNPSA